MKTLTVADILAMPPNADALTKLSEFDYGLEVSAEPGRLIVGGVVYMDQFEYLPVGGALNPHSIGRAKELSKWFNETARDIASCVGCKEPSEPRKENKSYRAKEAHAKVRLHYAIFRCNYKQANALMQAAAKKAFIEPLPNKTVMLNAYKGRMGFSVGAVRAIWANKGMLEQAEQDGLVHLAPVMVATGKSPKELREVLGKGLWKRLCGNTGSRNKALATVVGSHSTNEELKETLLTAEKLASIELMHLSKTVYNWKETPDMLKALVWAKKALGKRALIEMRVKPLPRSHPDYEGRKSRWWATTRQLAIYHDTLSMARQLGKTVNPEWSPRRLNEEHDAFSKELFRAKYSSEVFVWAYHFKPIEMQGWTATLLDSAAAIAQEGIDQGHCVAAWASSGEDPHQGILFSVKDPEGNKYSTVLVSVKGSTRTLWPVDTRLGQHYLAYNKIVPGHHIAHQLAEKAVEVCKDVLSFHMTTDERFGKEKPNEQDAPALRRAA